MSWTRPTLNETMAVSCSAADFYTDTTEWTLASCGEGYNHRIGKPE
jgi:hypothetical protein